MCLYPKLIKNRKYTANKKNGGVIPEITDDRVRYVPIGCQNCIECTKQRARSWQARMLEDIKHHKNGKFITLTFSNESIKELTEMKPTKRWPGMEGLEGYELDNEIATRATRLFLERWRKKFKTSLRHWLVTEIGHEGTENIHLHGIVWTNENFEQIRELWKYGYVYPNQQQQRVNFVSEKTVNYIIKYITKQDEAHKTYKPKILTSPGIGHNYTSGYDHKKNKYRGKDTNETYSTRTGHKISLPIYWRNKIYSEQEREKLWLNRLDKEERWVMKEKTDVSDNYIEYDNLIKYYRKINIKLGYGTDRKDQGRQEYEKKRRELMIKTRILKAQETANAQRPC